MTKEELLALHIGEATVGENLRHSLESGRIIVDLDGSLRLAGDPKQDLNWIIVPNGPELGCGFLMGFMFHHAYAESAVPNGCSACYKVKLLPRTLRELVAAWGIAKSIERRSKWGLDINNPYSQAVYAGYFYTMGLESARALYKDVREMVDEHPELGPAIGMTIKRGCSEYEAVMGPSELYQFAPERTELEAYLRTRFRERGTKYRQSMVVAHWIETAFRIGDDTYLDFTGGKRLRTAAMSYPPA